MKRSIVAAVTAVALLMLVTFQTVGAQQAFHTQDFSTAMGTTPPPGYSLRHGSANQSGGWRFDNPQGWALTGSLMTPVAIVDSDFAGSTGVRGRDEMYLPYFDASTATNAIRLNFDHDAYVYLTQNMFIDVFDGMTWNNVHTDLNVGTINAEFKQIDITAACGGSSTCRIRFKMTHDWDFYWMVDNILVEELGSNDMTMVSVDSPVGSAVPCVGLTTMPVICTFKSNGTANVPAGSVVLMSYDRDFGAQIENDTALILNTGGMNFGDTFQFTFMNPANIAALGAHNFDVSLSFAGDGNLANDTITGHTFTTMAPASTSTLPVSQNFDGIFPGTTPPAGWTQDQNDSAGFEPDWYFGTSTPSTAGPEYNGLGDHTSGTGGFAFIEDSSDDSPAINLLTPCVDLTTATAPKLSFWIHNHDFVTTPLNPAYFNPLSVDIISSTGMVIPDVAVSSADTGDVWVQIIVDLTPYVGQIVQVQFRGTNAGTWFSYDTSIDDVLIFEPGITFGQAPQPGIAVMDLNNAVDGNGTDVLNSTVGPFSTTASAGSALTFSFWGEVNQAVILIGGPLNPLVASYPGFGQFDIGNTPLAASGLPINLTLWADGSNPTAPSLNNLFNTGPAGASVISFTTPNIPAGVFTTFQALILNTVNIFGFSNAVELTIN